MKGVSAIIATILMLMITIALSGTAYLYISGFFGSKTGVVLSLDSSSRCTSSAFRVVLRNDGKSVASDVKIDITLPNSVKKTDACLPSPLSINAGGTNQTTSCDTSGGTNGNYGVTAHGGGSTTTGIIYCGSNPTSGTTTTSSTTTSSTSTSSTSTSSTSSTTTTGTGGTKNDYTTPSTTALNTQWQGSTSANQLTASGAGTLKSLGADLHIASGSIALAIYNDSSGNAGPLICSVGPTAISSSGWKDLTVSCSPSVTIISGHKYWIAFQVDNAGTDFYGDTGTASPARQVTWPYSSLGTFPSPFSCNYCSNIYNVALRMTYQ